MSDSFFTAHNITLKPQWIDYNGHLNMAYYLVIFDEAADQYWEKLGFGNIYRQKTGFTTYAASCKIDYIKEIKPNAILDVKMAIRDASSKKFILWQGIYDENKNLCASAETLTLHIDQNGDTPKVAPFPAQIFQNIENAYHQQSALQLPHLSGRPIEMTRPS